MYFNNGGDISYMAEVTPLYISPVTSPIVPHISPTEIQQASNESSSIELNDRFELPTCLNLFSGELSSKTNDVFWTVNVKSEWEK